jgi:hypothetical protein
MQLKERSILLWVSLARSQFILGQVVESGGKRRQTIRSQDALDTALILLKVCCQALLLSFLLSSNQLLLTGLSKLKNIFLGCLLISEGQKSGNVALAEDAELRVVAADIAFPVRVICEVGGGESDGVVV